MGQPNFFKVLNKYKCLQEIIKKKIYIKKMEDTILKRTWNKKIQIFFPFCFYEDHVFLFRGGLKGKPKSRVLRGG